MSEMAALPMRWVQKELLEARIKETWARARIRARRDALKEALLIIEASNDYGPDELVEMLTEGSLDGRTTAVKQEVLKPLTFNGSIVRKALVCGNCGAETLKDNRYCWKCGWRLGKVQELPGGEEDEEEEEA